MPDFDVVVRIPAPSAAEAIKSVSWALYHHEGTPEWETLNAQKVDDSGYVQSTVGSIMPAEPASPQH